MVGRHTQGGRGTYGFTLLVRNVGNYTFGQKTLEWPTISSVLVEMTVSHIPGYSRFTVGDTPDVPLLTTFNQLYAETGARSRGAGLSSQD